MDEKLDEKLDLNIDYAGLELRVVAKALYDAGIEKPTVEDVEKYMAQCLMGLITRPLTAEDAARVSSCVNDTLASLIVQGVLPANSTVTGRKGGT